MTDKIIDLEKEKKKREILKPKVPKSPDDLKDENGNDLELIIDSDI